MRHPGLSISFRAGIVAVALLSGISVASAQSRWHPDISFGVHGGADVSRIMFSPSTHENMKFGATGGVAFRYSEENHFGLIAEINWTQRGWSEDFRTYTQFRYSRTLNYIEIPVMAHIYFGRGSRFFFNAGPQISLMAGESTSANFDWHDISSVPGFPTSNRRNEQLDMPVSRKFDYGICAGLGGEWRMAGHHSLSFEARFYYGLSNIFPSARTDVFHNSNAMVISAAVGYWFHL